LARELPQVGSTAPFKFLWLGISLGRIWDICCNILLSKGLWTPHTKGSSRNSYSVGSSSRP